MRRVPERIHHHAPRDFGRAGPICVPTHAIHHNQKRRMFRRSQGDPVLIVVPVAEESDVGVVSLQEVPCVSVRLWRALYHREPGSVSRDTTNRYPMIASMTGFARREATGPWGVLVCELRSVNHRFLEAGFRLPEELRSLEPDLRQLVMRELKRGKVDCTVNYRPNLGAERALEVDTEALEKLLARVRELTA